jgi:hypothetical protein
MDIKAMDNPCPVNKCKIAFINVMDGYSGGEIVLQRLIESLDERVFEPIVYTKETRFAKAMRDYGLSPVIISHQYQLRCQRGIKAVWQALKIFVVSGRFTYDMRFNRKVRIVHSNSLTSSIYFAFWAKVFRLKFVAHNHLIRRGKVYKMLYRYIYFCSERVVCVSEAVKQCWLEEGVPEKKLVVIYNGVPDDFF